jgi:hypothetical protein
VLSVVLGFDDSRWTGWLTAGLGLLLIGYNAARFFITLNISPMRDHVDAVGISPAWKDYERYWRMHQIIAPILGISIIYGIVRIVLLLFEPVLVPAGA